MIASAARDLQHQRLALGARAVVVRDLAATGRLASHGDQRCLHETQAQHLGIGDRGEIDRAARFDGQPCEIPAPPLFRAPPSPRARWRARSRSCAPTLPRVCDLRLQRAALEVVPEPGEPGVLGLQPHERAARVRRIGLRGAQLGFGGLALRELAPIHFREMGAALALFRPGARDRRRICSISSRPDCQKRRSW